MFGPALAGSSRQGPEPTVPAIGRTSIPPDSGPSCPNHRSRPSQPNGHDPTAVSVHSPPYGGVRD